MLTNQLRSWSAVLLTAAVGCTDAAPGDDPEVPIVDTEAPTIVSTQPAVNATGVATGDQVVITFSEAMDAYTIESSYQSVDLPLSAVSMSWSEDMTVLTINPDAGLLYAEGFGNDPSVVPARTYSLTIGNGAADLAGNSLGTDFALSFATKRRMVTTAGLALDVTRVLMGDSLLDASTDVWVGDNDLNDRYISLVSFDLQQMPEGIAIDSAIFASRQLAPQGAPYTSLGAVKAIHLEAATPYTFLSAPETVLGSYSEDGTSESKSIDVTAQVADDIAHRAERSNLSQYRLQIDDATNGNGIVDKARFALGTFEMTLVDIAD